LVERWAPEKAQVASGRRQEKEPVRKKMLTGNGGSGIKIGRCDVGKKRSQKQFF